MPDYSDKQKEQMDWIESHGVQDKDSAGAEPGQTRRDHTQTGKPAKNKFSTSEIAVDMEIDVHGQTIDEAMALVGSTLEALKKSGHKSLRIIHGVGKNSPDSIAWKLNMNLGSVWKKRVAKFFHENYNEGATVVILR